MKTGNSALRALLFEAAWSYRVQAKVGNWMHKRRPDIPQAIVGIAWKAQVRLSSSRPLKKSVAFADEA
ncbi:hypothetical protein BMJ27_15615 [Sinorhizobium medicae]|nr:hypothetical protein BMJ27_15615 [Sinorhizobium medicae]PLU76412.1 hypothetical protein BMJ19_29295 [Sinorhizobium medicae]